MTQGLALAAILAGGQSRRMGVDKADLALAGTPLIEWVWRRVAPLAGAVAVVGGPPRLAQRGALTLADRYPGASSLGGIATALAYAQVAWGPESRVLCVACDLPFLEPRLLALLAAIGDRWDAVVPRVAAGYEPLCAVYRAGCAEVFGAAAEAGELRIRALLERLRVWEVGEAELRGVDPDLRSFWNVNRPEDLAAARAYLGGKLDLSLDTTPGASL